MVESAQQASQEESLPKAYRSRVLTLVAICSLLSVGGQSLFAPLLPAIIDDLGMSPSKAGIALSVMTALSAICRYPAGRFADHLSRKTVLVPALGTMTAGFAFFAVATDYATFLLAAVVAGIGAGLYLPSAFALLSDLFVERRGKAIGINNAAVSLGGVLAAGIALGILSRASWRVAFLPVALLFAVLVVFMHRWNREPYIISRVHLDIRSTARRLIIRPRIRWMVLSASLVMLVQRGAINFVPLFLQMEKGFSPFLATLTFASFFVVSTFTTPITGWLGDQIGYVYGTLGATLVGSTGLLFLLIGDHPPLAIFGVLVFALGITGFWPSMNAYVLTLFPDESMAGDFGALGAIYLGIGSIGPSYVGFVAERTTYHLAFIGLVLCLIVSVGINLRISRL